MALDGYIRVSQVSGREGESFISPSVQREQIERWTTAHDTKLGRVFEELDESGGRADRPLFLRAIERVEEGFSTGVIVAKLDRFGRSVLDGLAAIQRIEDAGGTFVCVADGLDLGTPSGKLMLRMMFVIGEWELDRSRENWDIARQRAVARGVYLGPVTPFGYRRLKSGRLKILRSEAVVVVELFRLRAMGVGVEDLARFLNTSHLRTQSGVPFSRRHVYSIVKNRVYLGESRSRPFINLAAHEAIIDSQAWELAQLPPQQPQDRSGVFLGSLVRCATCGYTMSLHPPASRRSPSPCHRCSQIECQKRAVVRCDELEPLVEQLIFRIRPGDRRVKRWAELQPKERRAFAAELFDCLYIERGPQPAIERAWVYQRGDGPGLARDGSRCIPLDRASGTARRLAPLRDWSDPHIKRELKAFFARRSEAVWPPYAEFARAGFSQVHAQAFSWGGPHYWGVRLGIEIPKRTVKWNEDRVRAALGPFLRGKTKWPRLREFQEAGLGYLHAAVYTHGGIEFWARQFDLQWKERRHYWTFKRIEEELVEFTRGRDTFPTCNEFRRAGKAKLYSAALSHGGSPYWRRHLGLAMTYGLQGKRNRGRLSNAP